MIHKDLSKRLITGCLLLFSIVAAILLFNHLWFSVFVGLALLIAAIEWLNLTKIDNFFLKLAYILLLECSYFFILTQHWVVLLYLPVVLIWFLMPILLLCYRPDKLRWLSHKTVLMFLGWFLLIPFSTAFSFLQSVSPKGLLIIITIVALFDSGAYFSGRMLGKHKLAIHISPKKTIEGVIGGLLCNLVFLIGLYVYLNHVMGQFYPYLLLVFLICYYALLGDLFESVIKRIQGVKDSGKILPGHGGILDRVDAYISVFPLVMLFMILTMV